jgi:hypothetical protein
MDKLQRFLDEDNRLNQWPAKRGMQLLALEYLASKFEPDKSYTEREVNDILNRWHTFGDWALLRRALVDNDLLKRKRDGTDYRRV